MNIEILKSSFGEDDDDMNRNFIWLELKVTHNRDSNDDEMINVLITTEGEDDFEIGFGDGYRLKEKYYSTIDEIEFYYSPIIKLLDKLNLELGYDVFDYSSFDSEDIIGFNIDL